MRHFLTTEDWTREELQALLDAARAFRANPFSDALARRSLAFVFFNPSMRTRSSFQVGAHQLGGHSVVLEPGASSWPIEARSGVVMDGDAEEHAREVVPILSRYFDMIGVRSFPKFKNWADDLTDPVLSAFAEYASVPVINMETIVHPCQELAMMMALQDRLGDTDGRKFTLSWVPHPRPLNTAVANSALLMAAKFGFDVTIAVPDEAYRLDERFMSAAQKSADANGRSITMTTDLDAAYDGANVVYAKSWGAIPYFGRWDEESALREKAGAARFMVDEAKMARTNDGVVSHCLPMRRNVKIADAVADSDRFLGVTEAENRLHVQKAVMARLAAEARS